jgi:hypothetical protein
LHLTHCFSFSMQQAVMVDRREGDAFRNSSQEGILDRVVTYSNYGSS